jgi:Protein of unknown function (DUF3341)
VSKNTSVYGIFATHSQAEQAVDELKVAGFRSDDISALFPDNEGTKDFAHEKNTKAPEGAAVGAGSGAIIGGTLGLLAGIGMLAIPGVGPFIAAGPIMGLLGGLGLGGTVGGVAGALVGLGIPEYEAKRYEGRIKEGGILLSVHCDETDDVIHATRVLEHCGAQDVASAGEGSADYTTEDIPVKRGF